MKMKIGLAAVTAALLGGVLFGALQPAVAAAEEDGPTVEAVLADGDHDYAWLRESIIVAAAKTIGIRVVEVKAGLRNCLSLQQIARLHGVGPGELKRGILAHETRFLAGLVETGRLTRAEAARLLWFLTVHIDRIVSHHCEPVPVV